MKFSKTAVPPKGRNKYGNYMSDGNVTKAVIRTVNYGDNTTGGGNINPKPEEPKEQEESFLLFLSKTSSSFDGLEVAITAVTESIEVIGYKNLQRCDTFVGDIENGVTGLTGLPQGITYSIKKNGTPETYINFTVNPNVQQLSGTIKIPCAVYRNSDPEFPLGNDMGGWQSLKDKCTTMWLEWSYTVQTTASNAYTLDLTNENASINCDADGYILGGAIRPTCKANLFYGTEEVTGATFAISYSSAQNVRGLSIDTETGQLTFGSNFQFDGTPLEIQVIASYGGSVVGRKIMTISKAFPGADGAGVTRWVTSSASAIYVDVNTNRIVPSSISLECWEQRGEDIPTKSDHTIYYGYDTEYPPSAYTGAITVNVTDHDFLSYGLRNSSTDYYELETIPIIRSGKNGQDSSGEGRQGAAVRGPVNYYSQTSQRRWCNGKLTDEDNYPDDGKWIDVIKKDNKTYVCTTSYTGSANDSWSNVSMNWTEVANEFDIVAADLILAENAAINFTTTNGLFLRDANNEITGGAQGGNGTIFWAGSDEPDDATFKVSYDGTVDAQKGKFGLLEIGSHFGKAELKGTLNIGGETFTNRLMGDRVEIYSDLGNGDSGYTVISNRINTDIADFEGDITVYRPNTDDYNAVWTNGNVVAEDVLIGTNHNLSGNHAIGGPFKGLKITFMTSTNTLFTKVNGSWHFNGIDLGVNSNTYIEARENNSGEWIFLAPNGAEVKSGIYSTSATKNNDTIYIEL